MVEVIVVACPMQSRQKGFGVSNEMQHATTSLNMAQIYRCLDSYLQTCDDSKLALLAALRKCGKLGISTTAVSVCDCCVPWFTLSFRSFLYM